MEWSNEDTNPGFHQDYEWEWACRDGKQEVGRSVSEIEVIRDQSVRNSMKLIAALKNCFGPFECVHFRVGRVVTDR